LEQLSEHSLLAFSNIDRQIYTTSMRDKLRQTNRVIIFLQKFDNRASAVPANPDGTVTEKHVWQMDFLNVSVARWTDSSTPFRCQFHQHFTRAFFYESALTSFTLITFQLWNFLSKEFQHKSCLWNVDEIDFRCQFHQRSMYSFYAHRSGKRKKILMT